MCLDKSGKIEETLIEPKFVTQLVTLENSKQNLDGDQSTNSMYKLFYFPGYQDDSKSVEYNLAKSFCIRAVTDDSIRRPITKYSFCSSESQILEAYSQLDQIDWAFLKSVQNEILVDDVSKNFIVSKYGKITLPLTHIVDSDLFNDLHFLKNCSRLLLVYKCLAKLQYSSIE